LWSATWMGPTAPDAILAPVTAAPPSLALETAPLASLASVTEPFGVMRSERNARRLRSLMASVWFLIRLEVIEPFLICEPRIRLAAAAGPPRATKRAITATTRAGDGRRMNATVF